MMVDTSAAGSSYVSNIAEMVRSIRLAVAEELAAANTYTSLAEGVLRGSVTTGDAEGMPKVAPPGQISVDDARKISAELTEIAQDEQQHIGKLLGIIERYCPEMIENMQKGKRELKI